jgi:hypothetical protein
MSPSRTGGIRRSKSASSVTHKSHNSTTLIDDHIAVSAHRNALTAANVAFIRSSNARDHVVGLAIDRRSQRASMDVIPEGGMDDQSGLRRSQSQRSVLSGRLHHVFIDYTNVLSANSQAIRRSHSVRRTMRQDEPGMIKQTLRNMPAPPASNKYRTTKDETYVKQPRHIRKTRSMVSWTTFGPASTQRNLHQPSDGYMSNERQDTVSAAGPNSQVCDQTQPCSLASPLGIAISAKTNTNLEKLRPSKIRRRTSFLTMPFRKRPNELPSDTQKETTHKPTTSDSRKVSQTSSRKSETIKDKLRRYFRKTSGESSRSASGLPPQHIEASRPHFGDFISTQSTAGIESVAHYTPNATSHVLQASSSPPAYDAIETFARQNQHSRVVSPIQSEATLRSRSRVTSWADSTVDGSVICPEVQLSMIAEDESSHGDVTALPTLINKKRNSSLSSSFFRTFLRKRDRGDANTSVGLAPAENTSRSRQIPDSLGSAGKGSSLSVNQSLVGSVSTSQHRRSSLLSITTSWRNKATIRSITPDITSQSTEFLDGQVAPRMVISMPQQSSDLAASQSYHPSPSQLQARAIRADNRWQGVLDEKRSLFFPHSSISPSRVASLRRAHMQSESSPSSSPGMTTPKRPIENSGFLLSPSVYSRATDECTPVAVGMRPSPRSGMATLKQTQDTAIKFSLGGPPPNIQSVQDLRNGMTSEWQQWLSDDIEASNISGLSMSIGAVDRSLLSLDSDVGSWRVDGALISDSDVQDDYLTSTPVKSQINSAKGHKRELAQIVDEPEDDIRVIDFLKVPEASYRSSPSHLSPRHRSQTDTTAMSSLKGKERIPPSPSQPTLRTPRNRENFPPARQSSRGFAETSRVSLASFMNDRFPMIDTGGPSSRNNSSISLRSIMAGKAPSEATSSLRRRGQNSPQNGPIARPVKNSPLSASNGVNATIPKQNLPRTSLCIRSTHSMPHKPSDGVSKLPVYSAVPLIKPYSTAPSPPHPITPAGTSYQIPGAYPSSIYSSVPAIVAPETVVAAQPSIVSPIPRRRQSTLVATLTSASLASTYHTAQQGDSSFLSETSNDRTMKILRTESSPLCQPKASASTQLGNKNGEGSGSTPSTGIRRSGAFRASKGTRGILSASNSLGSLGVGCHSKESLVPGAGAGKENGSPGKKLAERWMSDRAGKRGGMVFDNGIGLNEEEAVFL